jgi:Effector-associated domain 7
LYHAEALASELIQLVAAFRPVCRSGTKLTATKKNEIELKLRELAKNLESTNKTLEQLSESILGKEKVIHPGAQPSHPPVSAMPAGWQFQPLPPSISSSTGPAVPGTPMHVASDMLLRWREIMSNKYDVDEFKLLCIEMETDYDKLRAGKLELKMYYLIDHCNRHNKLEVLRQRMLEDFPDLQGQL